MKKSSLPILAGAVILAAGLVGATAPAALAYDGTHCKAPGNCWEPKPGFPEKIAGSK
jgi:methanol dehydrogenase (cytochrome c) subunit 2